MEGVFAFFGGRKMFFALAVILIACGGYFFGKMAEAVFVDLLKWVLLAYLGSNVLADVPGMFAAKPPEPPPPA